MGRAHAGLGGLMSNYDQSDGVEQTLFICFTL